MTAARPYEFDPAKEATNLRVHGYGFEDGYRVLMQPAERQMTWLDQRQDYGEDRWNTLGSLPEARHILLHVTWTERDEGIRLISVRNATAAERRRYEHRHDCPH
jgi:uncharacterized DUF497 family protein